MFRGETLNEISQGITRNNDRCLLKLLNRPNDTSSRKMCIYL